MKTVYSYERFYSLLAGFNYSNYSYAELGFAYNQYGINGHEPAAWSCFVSNEFRMDKKTIIGPKIGCWGGGGASAIAMGLNLIYYTDMDNATLRFRPEIGIAFDIFKVVYGYNIVLTNNNFPGINTHNFSIALLFGLKKIKSAAYRSEGGKMIKVD